MKKFFLVFILFFAVLNIQTLDCQKSTKNKVVNKSIEYFNKYSSVIESVIRKHVAPTKKEVLKNDKAMRISFGMTYEFLPTPFRWVVSKETFVNYCLKNRYKLVEVIPDNKKDESKASNKKSDAFVNVTNSHVEFGIPFDQDPSDDFIIKRQQYVLSYNKNYNICNWVSWNLDKDWYGEAPRFSGSFVTDPSIPIGWYNVKHADYTNSGYDRGHMVRSEERTKNDKDNYSTFYLTNVIPQTPDLNRGPWLKLELYCEDLCKKQNKELYLISGGIFHTNTTLNNQGNVRVPDSCYKIIVIMEKDNGLKNISTSTKIIAVVMPNINGIRKENWSNYITTVDQIENTTGYNFLDLIENNIENLIEARKYNFKPKEKSKKKK